MMIKGKTPTMILEDLKAGKLALLREWCRLRRPNFAWEMKSSDEGQYLRGMMAIPGTGLFTILDLWDDGYMRMWSGLPDHSAISQEETEIEDFLGTPVLEVRDLLLAWLPAPRRTHKTPRSV